MYKPTTWVNKALSDMLKADEQDVLLSTQVLKGYRLIAKLQRTLADTEIRTLEASVVDTQLVFRISSTFTQGPKQVLVRITPTGEIVSLWRPPHDSKNQKRKQFHTTTKAAEFLTDLIEGAVV